ncbi:microtubule associated serine/threonine kinase 2 (predicted), isoform CRA_b, partial [Rattus norvegicus]
MRLRGRPSCPSRSLCPRAGERRPGGSYWRSGAGLWGTTAGSSPLLFRKLSNPDIFSPTGKAKLQRQLSQDDCKLRRGSLASSLS